MATVHGKSCCHASAGICSETRKGAYLRRPGCPGAAGEPGLWPAEQRGKERFSLDPTLHHLGGRDTTSREHQALAGMMAATGEGSPHGEEMPGGQKNDGSQVRCGPSVPLDRLSGKSGGGVKGDKATGWSLLGGVASECWTAVLKCLLWPGQDSACLL